MDKQVQSAKRRMEAAIAAREAAAARTLSAEQAASEAGIAGEPQGMQQALSVLQERVLCQTSPVPSFAVLHYILFPA